MKPDRDDLEEIRSMYQALLIYIRAIAAIIVVVIVLLSVWIVGEPDRLHESVQAVLDSYQVTIEK